MLDLEAENISTKEAQGEVRLGRGTSSSLNKLGVRAYTLSTCGSEVCHGHTTVLLSA